MLVDESIMNIIKTAKFLKEAEPDREPVLASPKWFLDEVRAAHGELPDSVVESIGGCKVVVNESIDEPSVISAGGKVYKVLPDWARARKKPAPLH